MKPPIAFFLLFIFDSSIGVTLPWSRPDPMFAELKSASDELDKLREVVSEPPAENSLTSSGSSVSEEHPPKKGWTVFDKMKGAYNVVSSVAHTAGSRLAKVLPHSDTAQKEGSTMTIEGVLDAKKILGTRVANKLKQLDAKFWREITSWSPRYRNLIGSDLLDHVDRAMDCAILVSEIRNRIGLFGAKAAPSQSQLAAAADEVNEITGKLKGFEGSCPKVFTSAESENPLPIPTARFALLGPKEFISRLRNLSSTMREKNAAEYQNAGFSGLARQFRLQQEANGIPDATVPAEDIPRIRKNVKEEKVEFLDNLEKLARNTWSEVKGGSYSLDDANRVKAATKLLRSIGHVYKIVNDIVGEDANSEEGSNINSLLQGTSKMLSQANTLFHIN
jgi:hypothetical protein